MADAVHLGQAAGVASAEAAGHRAHRHVHTHTHTHTEAPSGFRLALQRVLHAKAGTGWLPGGVHRVASRIPAGAPAKPAATAPGASIGALSQAMALEGVPASWQPGLTFIMARESGGKVNAQSPVHSARGLYQLTAANYHYNPRGAASFGNAVEEAQGGIRYIRARYGTADNAVAFWHRHHWY